MAVLSVILEAIGLALKPVLEALLPLLLARFDQPKVLVSDANENQKRRDDFADVIAAHELRVLASESHDSP